MLATFSVTNVDDGVVTDVGDQPGTLRQAIFDANETPGADTIEFDSSLGGETILLTEGQLTISESVTIDATIDGAGPSQELLGITIDASGNDPTPDDDNGDGTKIFNISGGSSDQVEINGLTLTGGDEGGFGGGAILGRVA